MALALYAVKVRAEAMQKASKLVPSGMLFVIGRPQAQYKYACLQAKEHCTSLGVQEPVCSVASYLFPDGRVIAGHQQVRSDTAELQSLVLYLIFFDSVFIRAVLCSQALDFLQQNAQQLHFLRTKPVLVSGAFHTQLMASAVEPLNNVLRQVEVSQR